MDTEPEEELVGGNENNRNWKGIFISLLVIVIIIVLISIAAYLRRPPNNLLLKQTPFTFDDILDKNFEPKRFHGNWINENEFTYQNDTGDIFYYDCKTLKTKLLLSDTTIKNFFGEKSKNWMAYDKKIFLFIYDSKQLYRHSNVARYSIYNSNFNTTVIIAPPNQTESDQIQTSLISPDVKKLAFVQNNNIYLMVEFTTGSSRSYQITTDGEPLNIFNGISDWLYEEEIFGQASAMFWSPNSRFLAYIKFNDKNVDYYSFPIYDNSQYNSVNKIRYPKTGTKNPIAEVYIYDTTLNITIKLEIPDGLNDYYVWNVKWTDATSKILIVYGNRKQTVALYCIYDATSGKILLQKQHPALPVNWIIPITIIMSYKNQMFFQIWPFEGYKAIIKFHLDTLTSYTFTNHEFDVIEIQHLNENTGFLYYSATDGDSRQRHLFRKHINADQSSKSECLTCKFGLESNKTCLYNSPIFYGGSEYYILECLGPDIPVVYLKSTKNNTYYHILENNDILRELYNSKIMPTKEYKKIYLDNDTNAVTYAELIMPPKMEKDSVKITYPVLTIVYNGPTSQMVDFQFRIRKFEVFICTTFKTIIAIMDGRGTENNGDKYMKAVYKRLGEYETKDQILLAKELKKETYTDNNKFAIWGWSYGGFISAMTFFQDNEYQCGISGAPVTDWLFYDTAYTERFLGLYDENRQTYETKSNLTYIAKQNIDNLDDKKFLLIHGTGDDNVHFQNSAVLAKILRQSRMDFSFEVYPDVHHTPDEDTQRYLNIITAKFLMKCYGISQDSYTDFYPPRPIPEPPPKQPSDGDSKS